MICNWYYYLVWLQIKISSYPISIWVITQSGIWVKDIELLWFSESIYLIHTIADSVWWLKKKMLTSGFVSIITWGKWGPMSSVWCENFGQCLNERAGKRRRPTLVSSTFCISDGRELLPHWFIWPQRRTQVYVSEGWEEWRLAGTSFTESSWERCVLLPLAVISIWWFLLLSQNMEVEGFIDSRRLWYSTFCSCTKLTFSEERKGNCLFIWLIHNRTLVYVCCVNQQISL